MTNDTFSPASYQGLTARRLVVLAASTLVLGLTIIADILTGPAMLDVGEVVSALFRPGDADRVSVAIIHAIRLPMTCMALLVGAALGLAGSHMQTILGNPLASPFTLGFSSAAGFGAAAAILTGFSLPVFPALSIPVAALFACLVAAVLVYGFSRMRGLSAEVMVLAGIATMFLFQSLQSMAQYMASPEVLQQIVFWLFGSMTKANWTNVPIAALVVAAGAALLIPDMWRLTALRMGDDRAAAIGVDVRRLRIRVFAVVALLTAGAVAFVGTIGFVGLVAPHIARMLVGEDQRFLQPVSALMGALVMMGASILSKVISPGSVIPIGIVTAVIGVPFLFILIMHGRRRFW
ncbi:MULTISPECIES: iron ABC transporter permease [unclassified Minwuia]|jgi:iron complex transport system permease protein|uniref:FecCD family ABC transporter permease n=1 Tax=unclassified Minwuia TaxID=2618799 RepID=UPI002479FEF7|nr:MULTISPECIES: iron ABC transporter permease [unclassified Minwuia]